MDNVSAEFINLNSHNLGLSTMFWSSSSSSPADAYSRRIDVSTTVVTRAAGNKSSGYAVRCVKD